MAKKKNAGKRTKITVSKKNDAAKDETMNQNMDHESEMMTQGNGTDTDYSMEGRTSGRRGSNRDTNRQNKMNEERDMQGTDIRGSAGTGDSDWGRRGIPGSQNSGINDYHQREGMSGRDQYRGNWSEQQNQGSLGTQGNWEGPRDQSYRREETQRNQGRDTYQGDRGYRNQGAGNNWGGGRENWQSQGDSYDRGGYGNEPMNRSYGPGQDWERDEYDYERDNRRWRSSSQNYDRDQWSDRDTRGRGGYEGGRSGSYRGDRYDESRDYGRYSSGRGQGGMRSYEGEDDSWDNPRGGQGRGSQNWTDRDRDYDQGRSRGGSMRDDYSYGRGGGQYREDYDERNYQSRDRQGYNENEDWDRNRDDEDRNMRQRESGRRTDESSRGRGNRMRDRNR